MDEIRRFLESIELPEGTVLLVGCSGGPDSTALLYGLAEHSDTFDYDLVVGWYDHGLRPRDEIARERELVEAHCRELDLRFEPGAARHGAIARFAIDRRTGTEAAARTFRYEFLEEIRQKHRARYLALGHNRSDRAETVIQRFFQGGGPEGLVGMTGVSATVLRPLIEVSRLRILRYLHERGIVFSVDSTNANESFLRNRIRSELYPAVETVFVGFERNLMALSTKMKYVHDYLSSGSEAAVPLRRTNDGEWTCTVHDLDRAAPILRLYTLYRAFDLVASTRSLPGERLPFRSLKPLLERDLSRLRDGACLLERGEFSVIRRGDSFILSRRVVFEFESRYLMVFTGYGDLTISVRARNTVLHATVSIHETDGVEGIRVSGFPLLVRSRSEGDFMIRRERRVTVKELVAESGNNGRDDFAVALVQDRLGLAALVVIDNPSLSIRAEREPALVGESGRMITVSISAEVQPLDGE